MRPPIAKASWLPPLAAFAVFAFEARRYTDKALYFVDDPFISMRYAAALLTRGELAFNSGDRVEGYSNLLHVLLHALAFRLHGGVPESAAAIDGAAKVVLGATLIEAALLGFLAGAPGRREEKAAWYYAWVFTMAGWPFAFWATAGMETPLEGLLYVAILLAVAHLGARLAPRGGTDASGGEGIRQGRLLSLVGLFGVLLVLVTLLRFEGVLVALAIAGALSFCLVRARLRRYALALTLAVLAASGAYHVWRIAYFGALLPNTFVAKATGGSLPSRLQAGATYFSGWVSLLGGGIGLALIALALARRSSVRAAIAEMMESPVVVVASALLATKVTLVVWGGGDWMPGWRMLVPVTPVGLFLLVRVLLSLIGDASALRAAPRGAAAVVLAGAVVVCGRGNGASFPPRSALPDEAGGFKRIPRDYLLAGRLLERAFAGSTEEVAIGEAGLVPFEARDVRFMDLFGLVDRDMARQPGVMHSRVHAAHVLERAPGAVLFAHLQLLPPYGPYQYGPELLASPAFLSAYRLVDVGSELRDFGWALYLRRDLDPMTRGLVWAAADPRLERLAH
jgi:hypothetical protein